MSDTNQANPDSGNDNDDTSTNQNDQADGTENSELELSLEELGELPSEDELIRADVINEEIEQEDSQGVFQTSIDNRKALIAYTRKGRFLTLNFLQIPVTIEDDQIETLLKDALIRRAFDHARENNLEVIPQTPEVSQRFLERHPHFRELTKTDSEVSYRNR